ncbi:MAG: hypothetical protein ACHQ2F_07175 [Desulfobaccales bacterium]
MAITIFYSWQSDLPNRLNRTFIEKALEKAIKKLGQDMEVQEALRDEDMKLDKDTKGVPGTPAIAEEIFNKISNCGVFIADLTFVGKSINNRLLPNPNVLIEYGWALKALSNYRILIVFNSAFGEPTVANMPFDMRHLRNPITYHLNEAANDKECKKVKENLVNDLFGALKTMVESGILAQSNESQKEFDGFPYSSNPSTFLQPGETFIDPLRPGTQPLTLPDVQRLFLHIIPQKPVDSITSSKIALDLAQTGNLFPMGRGEIAQAFGRNKYGAFACIKRDGEILNLTQLFKSGELWGIDAVSINKNTLMEHWEVDFGFFPSGAFEKLFVLTLSHYLKFAKEILKLPVPLKFTAGATDVLGYRMVVSLGVGYDFSGGVVLDHITFEGMIEDYSKDPHIILRPFFEHVWEECGLKRPDEYKLYR